MVDTQSTKQEIIRIVHNPGEDKPWELQFDDLTGLQKVRATLNYPVHKFETEHKAIEVAQMLRSIVKADAVQVEGETVAGETQQPATFYHEVGNEKVSS